jgi:hypothetical protein
VSREILVQFVKFEAKASGREYIFTVKEASTDPREFILSIANQAFNERRVRYQDAAEVCSLRLRHELAANANHPESSHFCITDADLEEYRSNHAPKTSRPAFYRKPENDY